MGVASYWATFPVASYWATFTEAALVEVAPLLEELELDLADWKEYS